MYITSSHIVRFLLACMLAFSCVGTVSQASAAQPDATQETPTDEQRKIVVGYIDYAGFIEPDGNGSYEGYGVDYMEAIVQRTHWNVEYRHCKWGDIMGNVDAQTGERTGSLLDSGQVDLVLQAQHTDERGRDFAYSTYPIGYENMVVYTRSQDDSVYYDDPEGLTGKRFGFLESSYQNQVFETYAQQNGITFEASYFTSDTEQHAALLTGKVDAIVTGSLAYYDDCKVALRRSADPYYAICSKSQAGLIDEIDAALSDIITSDPSFMGQEQARYYSSSSASKNPLLTREEIEYIQQAPTIRVGQLASRKPLSSVDASTGQMTGVNEDIMNRIAELTGLSFEYVPMDSSKSPLDGLVDGDYDIAAGVVPIESFRSDGFVLYSKPFLTSRQMPVVRKGRAFDAEQEGTIAIPRAFQSLEVYVQKNLPQLSIRYYDTHEECLQAVVDGEADVFIQNEYRLSYLLQSPRFSSLELVNAYSIEEKSAIACRTDTDDARLLISILDKSIDCFSENDISDIVVAESVGNPYRNTPSEMLYEFRLPLMVGALAIVVIVVLLIVVFNRRRIHMEQLEQKNRQLAESTMQAQSASTAKSDFLAHMSHEIRTPMNAIIGLTELSRSELNNPDVMRDNLQKIETSSRLLLGIINDVLDMTAIENQRMKIENAPFDFGQVLGGLSSMYYAQAKQRKLSFEMRPEGQMDDKLVGDELRLKQVLINLLTNAMKFTPQGGRVTLHVQAMNRTDEKVFMRFKVEDTGVGMDEATIRRVFEPFEQESAGTARKHGGSGLGLSITKNLVGLMHGSISVESAVGKGSTFVVDVPFGIVQGEATMASGGQFADIRVLVVDDDADTLRYTADILDRMSIRNDVAESGEQALEMIGDAEDTTHPYDACFIDWIMPDMSGAQLVGHIHDLYGQDALLIIVSAYDYNEIENELAALNVKYYLPKPLFSSSVFDVLTRAENAVVVNDSAAQADEYDFTGKTVLVAEDIDLNMEVICRLLQRVGASVVCAVDGKQAVEAFEGSNSDAIDAILLDINMPVMNGFDAARNIRKSNHVGAATVPIYALTANAFTEDAAAAINAGMDGHLAKPIDTLKLYTTLGEAFSRKENRGDE